MYLLVCINSFNSTFHRLESNTNTMASILLRVCSGIHLILAIIVIIVQAVIIGRYMSETDPAFTQSGVGIWAGIILLAAAICLWLASKKSEDSFKIDIASLVLIVLALLASLAMIGLSSSVIHDIRNRFGTFDESQNRVKDPFLDFYEALEQRKVLESILLSCGIVAVVVDVASILFIWISFRAESCQILPISNK